VRVTRGLVSFLVPRGTLARVLPLAVTGWGGPSPVFGASQRRDASSVDAGRPYSRARCWYLLLLFFPGRPGPGFCWSCFFAVGEPLRALPDLGCCGPATMHLDGASVPTARPESGPRKTAACGHGGPQAVLRVSHGGPPATGRAGRQGLEFLCEQEAAWMPRTRARNRARAAWKPPVTWASNPATNDAGRAGCKAQAVGFCFSRPSLAPRRSAVSRSPGLWTSGREAPVSPPTLFPNPGRSGFERLCDECGRPGGPEANDLGSGRTPGPWIQHRRPCPRRYRLWGPVADGC